MSDRPRRRTISFGKAAVYRIVVQGRVSADTAARLGGMQVAASDSATGATVLTGRLRDQAELSGLLNTLYELHYPILEVNALEGEQ